MTTTITTATASRMTHDELLAEYNKISPTRRNALFKSKLEAIARINAMLAVVPAVEVAPPVEAPVEVKKPKRSKAAAPTRMSVGATDPKDVKTTKGADLVIKILTAQGKNPRREGTHAHHHFEQMRGDVTIREYLARFVEDERRTARQWLFNTVRDGHVKTEAQS